MALTAGIYSNPAGEADVASQGALLGVKGKDGMGGEDLETCHLGVNRLTAGSSCGSKSSTFKHCSCICRHNYTVTVIM